MRRTLAAAAIVMLIVNAAVAQTVSYAPNVFGDGTATSLSVGGALPATAANTLILGGTSTSPSFGADGEGALWIIGSHGATLAGRGTVNDVVLVNKSIQIALRVPTGTLNLVGAGTLTGLTGLTSSGTITFSGLTTGTNADFLCLSAANVVLIQTSACTISSMRFKNYIGPVASATALEQVLALNPIEFNMKGTNEDWNYDKPQVGLSAEDIVRAMPKCAIYEQDGTTPKSYRQECVIAQLIGSVHALKSELDTVRRNAR